jgi:hypothetical protein
VFLVAEEGEAMQTDSQMRPSDADLDDKEKESQEISRMIADLNEVRMRLDSVVRKLADTQREESDDPGAAETVEGFRVVLAGQLDRIREKLIARIPTQA